MGSGLIGELNIALLSRLSVSLSDNLVSFLGPLFSKYRNTHYSRRNLIKFVPAAKNHLDFKWRWKKQGEI